MTQQQGRAAQHLAAPAWEHSADATWCVAHTARVPTREGVAHVAFKRLTTYCLLILLQNLRGHHSSEEEVGQDVKKS